MVNVYIKVLPGEKMPEKIQFSSTWQENVYAAQVTTDELVDLAEAGYKVLECWPIKLD